MTEIRQLTNPPIAEAVIAMGVNPSGPLKNGEASELFSADFIKSMPKALKMENRQFAINAGPGEQESSVQHHKFFDGYRFESDDGSNVAVLGTTQALFSVAKNYKDWNQLQSFAKENWDVYRSFANPVSVNRIGPRYINRCEIALPSEIEEYLTAGPRLPNELGLGIPSFFSQVQVRVDEHTEAIVIQMLEQTPTSSNIILDVDVFRAGLDIQTDSTEIWDILGNLREWKNKLFFSHVTEKLLEPYL